MTDGRPAARSDHAADAIESALATLARPARLSTAEIGLVRSLIGHVEVHEAGSDLTCRDVRHPRRRLMLEGWACRHHLLADGRRQILQFVLPGELIGFSAAAPTPLDRGPVLALTRVVWADGAALFNAVGGMPAGLSGLAAAITRAEKIDQVRLIDHIVRLGRQSAYERMAHLLLELHERLSGAGRADGDSFPLPLTQEVIADALALSVVHVNRVLQRLRAERRIAVRGGRATLLRPDALALTAEYRSPFERM
jgi:CRP-like cAMP-binding protein